MRIIKFQNYMYYLPNFVGLRNVKELLGLGIFNINV